MIGYVTAGVRDLDRSAAFYDAVFGELGVGRMMEMEGFIVWGSGMDSCGYSITKPFNEEPMTAGNGTMFAIAGKSREEVDKVYARALAEGGSCEGEPGLRGDESMNFYAGYFRDPDGNKLNCFVMGA